MRPDDVLSALRDDIARIATDSKWTFYDGHLPRGPNPDRVAGIEARDVIGRDSDDVPDAFRFDIGVGDQRSRTAFQSTAWLVTFLDLRLAAALEALGVQSPKFAVVRPLWDGDPDHSNLREREDALSLSLLRLETIAACWDFAEPRKVDGTWVTVRQQHREARIQLADPRISPPSARSAADQAVRILSRALSRGSTNGQATAEPMCAVCLIRAVGEKTGPRCPTCAQWRWRNRMERPTSLDKDELASPYAAAARRRARGEGWGDS